MKNNDKANTLLKDFKGEKYIHGSGIIDLIGPEVARIANKALLVADHFPGSQIFYGRLKRSLSESQVEILAEINGAGPNAPKVDMERISGSISEYNPDIIISFGGGSTIDAVKSANVIKGLGGNIEEYFGTGLVSARLSETGKKLHPHCAIQTAASSAAHLTKYSNITDLSTNQKKLVVDDAIVPSLSVFDYETTINAPYRLTVDGAMDGIAHSVEVMYQMTGKPGYDLAERIAGECVSMVVHNLPIIKKNPSDINAREAIGLATDLGGYAIMIGGTNGPHLTSFSLVDIMSHGSATGMLLPYYTVFFANAITEPLRLLAKIFKGAGFASGDILNLSGHELGLAVAEAMIKFQRNSGFATKLSEIQGYTANHRKRALEAAKNPQLRMKLENMPVPLNPGQIDEYMEPILVAAETGDLNLIRHV